MFWYFGAIKKIPKNDFWIWFEMYFVYDSIWLNMMYIIEKHCLKWFACKVSQENIQHPNEIWRKTSKIWKTMHSQTLPFSISTLAMKWCAAKLKIGACTICLMSWTRIQAQNPKVLGITLLHVFEVLLFYFDIFSRLHLPCLAVYFTLVFCVLSFTWLFAKLPFRTPCFTRATLLPVIRDYFTLFSRLLYRCFADYFSLFSRLLYLFSRLIYACVATTLPVFAATLPFFAATLPFTRLLYLFSRLLYLFRGYFTLFRCYFTFLRGYFTLFRSYLTCFRGYFTCFRDYFTLFRDYFTLFRDYFTLFRDYF